MADSWTIHPEEVARQRRARNRERLEFELLETDLELRKVQLQLAKIELERAIEENQESSPRGPDPCSTTADFQTQVLNE